MSPGAIVELVLQVVAGLAVGWVTGDAALRRFLLRSSPELAAEFGWPERALIALLGLFACSVVAMVLNLVTGGAVFGTPGIVTGAGAVIVLMGIRRGARPEDIPWRLVILFLLLLILVYVSPVLIGGSGARLGDPQWHLGWTEQLLHGQAIPTGPAPKFARNAYPWGLHALLATLVRLVPGSSTLVALDATHVLFLLGLPLAAACLARRVRRDAGWFAAVAVSLVGGWGWLSAHGLAFAASPSQAHHGADLVVASPNAVYELFPPALPRELGLLALAAAAVLGALAALDPGPLRDGVRWIDHPRFRVAVAAGIAAGITGLVSVPLLITALVWLAAAALAAPKGFKLRLLGAFLGAALPVFALWAGPVVADYLHFGGFVAVTHAGTEWALSQGLSSWGLLLPASIGGLVFAFLRPRGGARTLLAFAAGSAVLMAVALARSTFSWTLGGNGTLLYEGRVWPPAHLVAAALAGPALAVAYGWLRRRARGLAVGAAVLLTLVGMASPALASIRLTHLLRTNDKGFIFGSSDFAPGGFVRRAAAHLGPQDVVLVQGSSILAFSIFSFSGARLARYNDPTLASNDLRIRYTDLAADWDRRVGRTGFRPDYTVAPAAAASPGQVVARGHYGGATYVLLRNP